MSKHLFRNCIKCDVLISTSYPKKISLLSDIIGELVNLIVIHTISKFDLRNLLRIINIDLTYILSILKRINKFAPENRNTYIIKKRT